MIRIIIIWFRNQLKLLDTFLLDVDIWRKLQYETLTLKRNSSYEHF